MIVQTYIQQLLNKYQAYLKTIIAQQPFETIVLRGGKTMPTNYAELSKGIDAFKKFEKTTTTLGWNIEWTTASKKLSLGGSQIWPKTITVDTEADFLFLIKKETEVILFKKIVANLLIWKPNLQEWLLLKHTFILGKKDYWVQIRLVVDFILQNDVSTFYRRNLPIAVHTKFIDEHEAIIASLLQYLSPNKFSSSVFGFDDMIGLKNKAFVFPTRWLDVNLANRCSHGMEINGVTATGLAQVNWRVPEIWIVENETALYMLPNRKNALAICSMGKNLWSLNDIPFFKTNAIFYWGDMDEDGFGMLSQCRKMYAQTKAILMDSETVTQHQSALQLQHQYKTATPEHLTEAEKKLYQTFFDKNYRIEQEQLNMDYILKSINAQ